MSSFKNTSLVISQYSSTKTQSARLVLEDGIDDRNSILFVICLKTFACQFHCACGRCSEPKIAAEIFSKRTDLVVSKTISRCIRSNTRRTVFTVWIKFEKSFVGCGPELSIRCFEDLVDPTCR